MNIYECWIDGRMAETKTPIEAKSSFEARRIMALRHKVDITDVAARRDGVAEYWNERTRRAADTYD